MDKYPYYIITSYVVANIILLDDLNCSAIWDTLQAEDLAGKFAHKNGQFKARKFFFS